MADETQGYPLFGAPFNEVTDYGFDAQSLVTSLLPEENRPSTHADQFWRCSKSYCLYVNKKAKPRPRGVLDTTKASEYVQSNPLDMISTSRGDFICHSKGSQLQKLRICSWNDQTEEEQLKTGNTYCMKHQIERISHCTYSNDETVILSWNRHNADYLAMKSDEFEAIYTLAPPANSIFKSGIICPLPFVYNSGQEYSVFFASNGSLILPLNHKSDKKQTNIDLKYAHCPPWSEVMWSQHPRVLRYSCDMELLTIDLRQDQYISMKHKYFDPITAVTSYGRYISTVGLQGVALYDDRMMKRPLSKWRFYDFDFNVSDGMFSRLQIYPLNTENGSHGEQWIIASGQGQRVWIYPVFSASDSPIVSEMPFNIDRYTACFGPDVRMNGLLACQRNGKHHIIAQSEYGSMLCTQFELTQGDVQCTNDEISEHERIMDLQHEMHIPSEREKKPLPKSWHAQIENGLKEMENEYNSILGDEKIGYFTQFLLQFEDDILEFVRIPRTTKQIQSRFRGNLEDLDHLSVFDFYRVLKLSKIGLKSFQIRSAVDLETVKREVKLWERNMLDVVTTYFVTKSLDDPDYLPIEEMKIKKEEVIKIKEELPDSVDLTMLSMLSQQAETQPAQDESTWNNIKKKSQLDTLNEMEFEGDWLFETNFDVKDECANLCESLARKWRDSRSQYVDRDWRQVNGNPLEYHGTKHQFRRSTERKIKRSWT